MSSPSIQSTVSMRPLEESACFDMMNIGKLGKPYARFDEGGQEEDTRFGYSGTVRRNGLKLISRV